MGAAWGILEVQPAASANSPVCVCGSCALRKKRNIIQKQVGHSEDAGTISRPLGWRMVETATRVGPWTSSASLSSLYTILELTKGNFSADTRQGKKWLGRGGCHVCRTQYTFSQEGNKSVWTCVWQVPLPPGHLEGKGRSHCICSHCGACQL